MRSLISVLALVAVLFGGALEAQNPRFKAKVSDLADDDQFLVWLDSPRVTRGWLFRTMKDALTKDGFLQGDLQATQGADFTAAIDALYPIGSGVSTVTLPDIVAATGGSVLLCDGGVNFAANPVTVAADATDTLDSPIATLDTEGACYLFVADWNLNEWFRLGGGGGGPGGGTAVELDLGNDSILESAGLTRLSSSGDTNGVVSEPSANQVLFDFANAVPLADALSSDPSPCPGGQYVTDVAADGTLTCSTPPDTGTVLQVDTGGSLATVDLQSSGAIDFVELAGVVTGELNAGAFDALSLLDGGLCGTNEILEDQGAAWACVPTPSGGSGGDEVLIDGTAVADGAGVNFIAGDGIAQTFNAGVSPDTNTIAVDLNTTADGAGLTSSLSGMEFTATGQIALIQGCGNGNRLAFNSATSQWECSAAASSEWTDTGSVVHPTETSDDVAIGGSAQASSTFYLDAGTGLLELRAASPAIEFHDTDLIGGTRGEARIVADPSPQFTGPDRGFLVFQIETGQDGDFDSGFSIANPSSTELVVSRFGDVTGSNYFEVEWDSDTGAVQSRYAGAAEMRVPTLDRDDCLNNQGEVWFDSTDSDFEGCLQNTAGAPVSLTDVGLEEEGEINDTVVTGNGSADQLLVATGTNAAVWVSLPTSGTDGCSGAADKLLWNGTTNSFVCGADAGAGGGMTSFSVQSDTGAVLTVTDGETLDIAGGLGLTGAASAGSPEQVTLDFDYTEAPGTDPALAIGECIFGASGLVCEGSVADAFEGLFLLPDVTGADSTQTLLTDASSLAAANLTGTIADARVDGSQEEDEINHDNLVGFVANEHIDWTANGAGTIDPSNYVDNTGTDDQNASEVPFTPAAGLSSTDVQAAIVEVEGNHTVDTTLTEDQVEDFVGGMLGGTQTRIVVTYDDVAGTLSFVVDDMNDDVPDAGDFGNAVDLDANGALLPGVVDSDAIAVGGVDLASTDVTGQLDISDHTNLGAVAPLQIVGDTVAFDATASVTLTGEWDLSGGGIVLPQSAAPTPTGEGDAEWDTDDDLLVIGDGVGQEFIVPAGSVSGAATMSNAGVLTLSSGAVDALAQIDGSLCGTNEILEDQGGSWGCIATPSGGGSLTVREVDLSPSVSGVSVVEFDQDDFTVSDQTGGVVRIESTAVAEPTTTGHDFMRYDSALDTFILVDDWSEMQTGLGSWSGDATIAAGGAVTVSGVSGIANYAALEADIGEPFHEVEFDAGALVLGGECTAASGAINGGRALRTVQCEDLDTAQMGESFKLPTGFTGTITVQFAAIHTAAAPTGNLVLQVAAQCRGDSDAANGTYSSEVDVSVTFDTQNDWEYSAEVAVTPDGTCVGGDTLFWYADVDAADTTASGTLETDVHLKWVNWRYQGSADDA